VQSSLQQHRSLGIIMCDVDDFKSFNDNYGHQAGDEVLRIVSEVLVDHVREMDNVFRFGGEEFVIVMPSADISASLEVAERVRSAVEMTDIKLDEQTFGHVTISLGVAVLLEGNDSAPDLINRADKALYDAKESGRNQIKTRT
jgi:diguanylate cyclase